MYSESDIENAVAKGAITAEAADALRRSVAESRAAPAVDEESFRLITGFNDIFVAIATILLLAALGWLGGTLFGGPLVAAASWALAEYFTHRRRMALPSILLLLSFVGGVGMGCVLWLASSKSDIQPTVPLVTAGLAMAGAAWLHWRRFHVPITIAALTGGLALTVIAPLVELIAASGPCAAGGSGAACTAWITHADYGLVLVIGLAVFAFAMRWDMSDPARVTRRSDIAFWLHLGAAPMIAHPIFWLLGVMNYGAPGAATAGAVILLYLLFGLVALAVDRRALLVSSLVYVLYALSSLFQHFGGVSVAMALTALVIGSALLMLSAFWHIARRLVVTRLPAPLRARLPVLDRPAAPAMPASGKA